MFKKLITYRLAWFTSYLSDRQQAVVHGKGLSSFTYMKSGVPKGFILGPTLFLLSINDLPLFMNYCYSDFFADDATLHTHDNKPDKVENKLQCGVELQRIGVDKIICTSIMTKRII